MTDGEFKQALDFTSGITNYFELGVDAMQVCIFVCACVCVCVCVCVHGHVCVSLRHFLRLFVFVIHLSDCVFAPVLHRWHWSHFLDILSRSTKTV